MKLRAYLLLTMVVAIWGATFVVVKGALDDATPGLFNLVRMTISFAVLAVVYRGAWRGMTRRHLLAGAVVGFFLAMGYEFQTIGLARTTPSKSAFITGLLVVLVPLLALIPGVRPKSMRPPAWNALFGALLAFVGIVLLTAPAVAGSTGLAAILPDFRSVNTGDWLTLGCSLGFALHCLALSHTSAGVGFRKLAMLQIGFAALFMLICLPMVEQPAIHWSSRLITALIVAAVLATAVAFSIQSWSQALLPPSHTALILTLEPVFAWLTSFLFFGERLGARQGAGALLILAGIAATELLTPQQVSTAHEA